MKKNRVLIVEDQYISRQLFEVYIHSSEQYELVKAISSAAYAHDYVLSQNIDLVIMDIFMNDGSNGLDAAERIKKKCRIQKSLPLRVCRSTPGWSGRGTSA